MKVTLNIQDDAELRLAVKNAIKGQVLSIVREELQNIISEELQRKIKGLNESNFNQMVSSALVKASADILYTKFNVSTWNNDFIRPFVEAKIEESLTRQNWTKLVDDLAKEKIRKLI